MIKLSPKKVKVCPACPPKELELDMTPKFNFVQTNNINNSKKITIIDNIKNKTKGKIKTLF